MANRAFLAPLAGVSDAPFRRLCARMGAGLTFTEMLPSNAVINMSPRTLRTIQRHPEEPRVGVQVTGPTPEEIAAAISKLDPLGFDAIDINMGCPMRKIVARGCGSAMLLDPERVTRTVALAREATARPLSVKIRLGYRRGAVNVDDIAGRAAAAGADMITIHGRTRQDHYGIPVDMAAIRAGAAAIRAQSGGRAVVVANGDVLGATSARALAEGTGCDAVMVARGALGNPWIFRDILGPAVHHQTPDEWLDIVLEHMAWHDAFYEHGPLATKLFRKHLLWYAQGFTGARRLRDTLLLLPTFDAVRAQLRAFVAGLPPGETRVVNIEYRLNQDG